MENNSIARIKYYKGQMLTKEDFEDQQTYHRESFKLFLKRFPPGILNGLEVEKTKDKNNIDVILIREGLAIDSFGNYIFVPQEGITIPIDEIPVEENKRYLSLT